MLFGLSRSAVDPGLVDVKDNESNRKGLTHTQEGSHVLLDLADLVRGQGPHIFRRLATKAEVTEGTLGMRSGLSEGGFQALVMS